MPHPFLKNRPDTFGTPCNSNLNHLTALKSTTNVLLLSNHQQIMMMIVGTGLVCGALPFQILDLRNAASKCVEIFSE